MFFSVFVLSPPIVFGQMKPGWNKCSGDVAREQFASHFKREPLAVEQISYRWAGDPNGPVLVMLHGLDSASVTFDNILDSLGEKYRLLLVDLRGHGKTPAVGTDYWPATLADDVVLLAQHLNVPSFHLLGHSFGARVGIRVVERAPAGMVKSFIIEDMDLERRLVLNDATAAQAIRQYEGRLGAYGAMRFPREALILDMAERMFGGDKARAESVVNRRTSPETDGRVKLLYRPWVSAVFAELCAADDGLPILANTTIPVLDLRAGSRDGEKVKAYPPAKLVVVKGSGHVIHRTHPVDFVREVTAFLGSVPKETTMTATTSVSTATSVIADAGTKPFAEAKKRGALPRGSALITSSGKLKDAGITHIVHAATGGSRNRGGEFEPTLESVRHSVVNSLTLAKNVGAKRVALPFVGGAIFLGRIGTTQEKLAETIVQAALDGRGDLELRFTLFSDDETTMFRRILKRLNAPASVVALKANITVFAQHGSDVIVNAANCEVVFGSGVSGAIASASQNPQAIDAEAAAAIKEYNAPR